MMRQNTQIKMLSPELYASLGHDLARRLGGQSRPKDGHCKAQTPGHNLRARSERLAGTGSLSDVTGYGRFPDWGGVLCM